MLDCSPETEAYTNSRPSSGFQADLFTFQTVSGTTYRYTSAARSVAIGGETYPAKGAKLTRGKISASRGVSVDSHQLTVNEQNGALLEAIELGYFNLATYTLGRIFAPSATSPWLGPETRFVGIVASVDEVGLSYAKLTIKSMLYLLDNDFPRVLIQPGCSNYLFSAGCGLSRAAYTVTGTVLAGSTQNTVKTALTQAAGYFSLGILTFTSGTMKGISYMVKTQTAGGTIYPAYPLLTGPAAGDTFSISPGCDKTLATCQGKYGHVPSSGSAPFFRGMPFVPDPVCTY